MAKKQYLVGYAHATTVPKATESPIEAFVAERDEVQQVRALGAGHRVLEMSEEEARKLGEAHLDLIIEEDLELQLLMPMPGLPPRVPVVAEQTIKIKVVDERTRNSVTDATVYCFGREVTYKGITDSEGVAQVRVMEEGIQQLIVSPRANYWSKVVSPVALDEGGQVTVFLGEFPTNPGYPWGYLSLRTEKVVRKFRGKGIKIGVIDSGVAEHTNLKAAGGYNTLDGQDPTAWNVDEKGHGTHSSGIMVARCEGIGITGVAPEAQLYSLKIFPGGRSSDLIEAINWCVDNYIDVISMSLRSPMPSALIEMALAEAADRGITCLAAAGNDGGDVAYPAAYESVIAVSAIGMAGSFPPDSAHAQQVTDYGSPDGSYFFAAFSNFGRKIDVCAPGIAVLSTVPTGYAAWDGTSMACAFIAGLAALILEAYPEIRTGDRSQPDAVRAIIRNSAIDLGLPSEMQGAGLPNAAIALRDASFRRVREEAILSACRNQLEAMLERAKKCAALIEQSLAEIQAM